MSARDPFKHPPKRDFELDVPPALTFEDGEERRMQISKKETDPAIIMKKLRRVNEAGTWSIAQIEDRDKLLQLAVEQSKEKKEKIAEIMDDLLTNQDMTYGSDATISKRRSKS